MKQPEKAAYFPKAGFIISVIVLCALIITGGYFYYQHEKKAIWQEKNNDLTAIAQLKVNQIYEWLGERMSEALYFSNNPALIQHTFDISDDVNTNEAIAYFSSRLTPIRERHGYENIFIVGADHELLYSLNEMNYVDSVTAEYTDSAMMHKLAFLTDFYICQTHQIVHLDIVAPLISSQGRAVGSLVFRIDPNDYLFPLIQSWPTDRKTSETLIIRQDEDSVLFLNELRHMQNTAMNLKVPMSRKDIPAVQAVLGREGVFDGKDYRDVDVLSVIRNIPDTPWYMIAKVDKSEVFSVLYYKAFAIIAFVIMLILLGGAGIAWIYHYRQRNIYRGLYEKEKELGESKEMLKRSQEIARVGSWDFYPAKDQLIWSEETFRIFGIEIPPDLEIAYTSFLEYIHPEDRPEVEKHIQDSKERIKYVLEINFRIFRKKSDKICYIVLKCDHVRTDDGALIRSLGMVQDITERKKYEEKLIRQNKEYQSLNEEYQSQNTEYQRLNEEYLAQNEELGRSLETLKKVNADLEEAIEKAEESDRLKTAFLNNMSHEIRTPMNAIMGFASLLEDNYANMKQLKHINIIYNNAEQLIKIVDDIINISRLETEKAKVEKNTFSIKDLFEDLYQTHQQNNVGSEIQFRYIFANDLEKLSIVSDKQKIRQVISGLLENAFKYTKQGSITYGCKKQGNKLRFYVEDTGMGISEKERPHVFDRFFRGDKIQDMAIRGTGLGLSIAKSLVEIMDGEIGVDSTPGKGSIFYFILPCIESETKKQQKIMEKQHENKFSELKVLIVDDEPDSLEYLKLALIKLVKEVDEASNGEEAISLAKNKEYNLVLMDIKMPVVDGLEATKAIREKHPDTIIIAQTAYAQKEERAKALATGCNDYLVKPIRKSSLLDTLEKYFTE